jgi:uncharacterized membrane protein YbhN (UPF0104 family)
VFNNLERLNYLFNFSIHTLFLLIFLVLLNISIRGIINLYLYPLFSVKLSLAESIRLVVLNIIGNQLPLAGGMVAKGVYLKQKHNLAFSHYLPVTAALYVCFIGVSGFLGLTVLLYLYAVNNTPFYWLLWIAFTGFVVGMISLWLPIKPGIFSDRVKKQLLELNYGWQALGKNPALLMKLCILQVVVLTAIGSRFFFEFQMVSQDVALSHCFLFSASTILTRLLSFAPGAIGLREGIVGIVSEILGFDFALGATVVMIDRLLILMITGILTFLYFNARLVKKLV